MNREQRRALERQPLWQAQVTTREGKQIPASPATNVKSVVENICQAINVAVAKGKEKNWRDAVVVRVESIET